MRPKHTRIQVMRIPTRGEDRFFYFDRGQRIAMAPALAIRGAQLGQLRIQTMGDRRPCTARGR